MLRGGPTLTLRMSAGALQTLPRINEPPPSLGGGFVFISPLRGQQRFRNGCVSEFDETATGWQQRCSDWQPSDAVECLLRVDISGLSEAQRKSAVESIAVQTQASLNLTLGPLLRIVSGWTGDGLPPLPKTIDVSVDYLRSGKPRETFARAHVQKAGRRVVHVHVAAWQDAQDRPIAMMRGNFLMPD